MLRKYYLPVLYLSYFYTIQRSRETPQERALYFINSQEDQPGFQVEFINESIGKITMYNVNTYTCIFCICGQVQIRNVKIEADNFMIDTL